MLRPPPHDRCPLCQGEVGEVRWIGHWLEENGFGGSLWGGRCSACDTVLSRRSARDASPDWVAEVPSSVQLQSPVPAEELAALTTRFRQLAVFGRKWAAFLDTRRDRDEVWRFVGRDFVEGYAVVRQGRPLAQFLTPAPEVEQELLRLARRA
jgi:hypothetical protein